ncbi:low affinity immunoglobulin gamma Fc region receptor III-A-like isoform X2 [Seriola aureovittata]|uniref:low affinity immunoglobulin gamma Fc region receptor III-A-like isoform X2 n=1 Tax=Seriola aureovittata TaxID=2871759 RepID=UPI0024BDEA0C|nr:low affinity immunoglobulin gamma Fc region receptor III-A-like isoform X2 [Seriola aureovittata]
MDISSLCLLMSTLSIHPNRSQFFRYETFTLSCAVPANSSSWTLKRNTSSGSFLSCEVGWGRLSGSSCSILGVYSSDTGVYWCESKEGERSNVLHISVNSGTVLLESPALPVTEGDKVTLRCSIKERYEEKSKSDFDAAFYKNDVFIGIHSDGTMILPAASKSDEGFYKCRHPTKGESPQSLLAVRVRDQPTVEPTAPPLMSLPRLLCTVLLFVIYTAIMIMCIYLYRRLARAGAAAAGLIAE